MNQEEQFIQLAKEGHPSGVEALYRKYFPAIYRFCYWQTNRSADAEDLTQDIFIEMAKSIRHFKGEASFKNWLYVIAKRQVAHWIKQKYNLPTSELLDSIGDTDDWIDEDNSTHKTQLIKKLLSALSPQEKVVIQLRYLKNLTVKETAQKLKISEANVKVICHRCLKKLQNLAKL